MRAEKTSARHRLALARVVATSVSDYIAQIKDEHESLCRQIAEQDSTKAVETLKIVASTLNEATKMQLVSGTGIGAGLAPGQAGKTAVFETGVIQHGNRLSLALDTTVRFVDGKTGRVRTDILHNVSNGHRSSDSEPASGWHICMFVGPKQTKGLAIGGKVVSRVQIETLLSSSGTRDKSLPTLTCPLCGEKCVGIVVVVPDTEWKVVVLETLQASSASLLPEEMWLGGSAIAMLLGLLIVFGMGNRLARPIARLSYAASAMAAGDFRRRVKVKTGDELENLAAAFNSLGSSLTMHELALKEQALMLTGMVEAAREASSSLDLKKCGKAIAKAVCEHLGAADAVVFRKNSVDGGLKILGACGQRPKSSWKRLANHSADSGGYLVMTEHITDGDPGKEAFLVGVPLTTGSGNVGAIVARFEGLVKREDLKLGSMRADLLITYGIHAAASIGNAEVYSQTEKYSEVLEDWVDHLSSVMEVTNAISPKLDLNETLHALAKATASAMSVDQCAIYLPDRDGVLAARSSCVQKDPSIRAFKIRPGESVTGKAFAEKRYAACYDGSKSLDPNVRRISEVLELRSILSAPLLVDNKALGAITVYNREPHQFSPREIRLLTSIALHAAVTIRNAGLYTRESSIAEVLQNSLVSEAPEFCRGLHFASRYIPALDEARVGGDFYDVSVLPDGNVGVVIGDVSGKGLMAAIHLATCKHMLRALMFAHPGDPACVLRELNACINHFFDLSFFVTVFCGIIDPEKETLAYANAGHPPALLISQEGKMQHCLASTGVPVGSGLECEYDAIRLRFAQSEMLLLYTDGVTDADVDGRLLEVEGIQRIVFEVGSCGPSDIIDGICTRIGSGSHATARDDIAMLAVAHSGRVGKTEKIIGGSSEQRSDFTAHAI